MPRLRQLTKGIQEKQCKSDSFQTLVTMYLCTETFLLCIYFKWGYIRKVKISVLKKSHYPTYNEQCL